MILYNFQQSGWRVLGNRRIVFYQVQIVPERNYFFRAFSGALSFRIALDDSVEVKRVLVGHLSPLLLMFR